MSDASGRTWSGPGPPGASRTISSRSSSKPCRLGGSARQRSPPPRGDPRAGPGPQPRPADRQRRTRPARYERIAFEKALVAPQGQPLAAFVCPGHPLLDSVIDLTLERHRDLLKRRAVLVDDRDPGRQPRVLFYLEHAIQDASLTRQGDRRVVSKRMLYVELGADGSTRHIHYASYLDYRPSAEGKPGVEAILARPECAWIGRELEQKAVGHAVARVVPEHLAEVREPRMALIAKTEAVVKDRPIPAVPRFSGRRNASSENRLPLPRR